MNGPVVQFRLWMTLALLCLLYILSFIDRFMLALLVTPMKADLGLSDLQLGLLFGTFFAILYGLLGVPLARLADRGNRKRVILAGVLFWSACTLGSAFAQNYATLALLRAGLAIGEAALTPTALSILTDAFPERKRGLAATLYTASGMLGASLFFVIGAGVLAGAEEIARGVDLAVWRIAFILVGLPGFVLAALFAFVVREPRLGEHAVSPSLGGVVSYLRANARFYGGLFAGAGAAQMLGYALAAWSLVLVQRTYGIDVKEAGLLLGVGNAFALVGGTLVMPTVFRMAGAYSPQMGACLPAVAVASGMALIIIGLQSASLPVFLSLIAFGNFLVTGTVNAIQILIQPIAPPRMRATITALLLICISCFGLGLGPPLAALAAEFFGGGIGVGLTVLAVVDLVLAVGALALAARPLRDAFADTAPAETYVKSPA